jgi:5,10-methylenetetrahydromethanopterin reductase
VTELWTLTHSHPRNAMAVAQRAETAGWDGMLVVDSQNLAADSYVALAMAASVTQRLGLGTGVTNCATRHPAVTASAAAAVQDVSNGRMVLGIGRGDSALAHLGRAPARFAEFERYVDVLQRYLRGEAVAFSDLRMDDSVAKPVASLDLADHPSASRIRWIKPNGLKKVPVEVAATGPRVIGMAARLADRVMFTLGAVPERITWGMETARAARRDAGLDPAQVQFGAYVNVVCHPDRATARALVRGGLTTFARFSVMHGSVAGPVSPQAGLLDDDFVDRFAIAGPPDYCIERLRALQVLGMERIAVSGPTAGSDADTARVAMNLLDTEVLPGLR